MPKNNLTFIKGAQQYRDDGNDPARRATIDIVKSDFNDVLSSKNLTFLFGSGCSSQISDDRKELGIPTMGPMAQGLLAETEKDTAASYGLTAEVVDSLDQALGINLRSEEYAWNLERLMEVLFGFQFALNQTSNDSLRTAKRNIDTAIEAIKKYVFETCRQGQQQESASQVLNVYQIFYRKLSQRSRSLPRPTIATTNYDLFNEIAMDRIGMPYINGFLGSVEKRFNPASFRYTIAQRLDLTSQRWTSLDNLAYLLKLHGSLNWHEASSGIFPVEERPLSESGDGKATLIYPTPAKQNASFAAPYSDIFREFQTRVVQEQSVLVVLGYGFGDEHVNNIIYQALTIPTFRLVIFAAPELMEKVSNPHIKKLQDLKDPRIWIIGTENSSESNWKAHYFKGFVEDIMPASNTDPADKAIENLTEMLKNREETGSNDD